jgi:hypothetical protein
MPNNAANDTVVKPNLPNEKKPIKPLTLGSVKPDKWTLHAGLWQYTYSNNTTRKPDYISRMRGWTARYWAFAGAKIILKPKVMDVWVKHKKGASKQVIYGAWSRADKAARAFSDFAQIAIQPVKTDRPADIANAHLVLQTKDYNQYLKPIAQTPQTHLTGLLFDKSHPNKPEFVGQRSAEGALGFDWMMTVAPAKIIRIEGGMAGFEEYNRNIKLHLKVLKKMEKALEKIAKG